ncbi:protease inhibitor EpiC2B [Phytophthora cinnamomi]|uniref:protease inhibitor EpiC2B n=1 Tax=Phytophthora cinnamomi TaxID=4785 RepID=UPI0035594B22|nr:protease inhibitor EpiC2B [Phytophthora cinnamomi]
MPYLRAITSSIFALALVSVSVPGAQAGAWTKTTVTDADTTLLLSAVGDVSTYSSGVATFLCVYKVNSLETQAGTAGGIANYDFGVTACNAGAEGDQSQEARVEADIGGGFAAGHTARIALSILCRPHTRGGHA